ncbi:MAG: hypothetical protein R3F49_19260 [Planctomycetota bacterium]
MKPANLDPTLELRDAVSLMMGATDRMALLDEEGRIAAINPAWREASRRSGASVASSGRGADFLDLCERAAADGERDAAEFAAAIRRVMARELTVAHVPLTFQLANGTGATSTATVRRVRGPLENWFLIGYADARQDSAQPTALPEVGVTLGVGLSHDDVRREMDAVMSHVALLDTDGAIFAVNAAWRAFAATQGADASATGPGVNYLDVCESALRSGDRRGAQFAQGLRAVLERRRRTWWLDSRINVAGEVRLFRGRVTRVESPDGPFVIVAHTDMSAPNIHRMAA